MAKALKLEQQQSSYFYLRLDKKDIAIKLKFFIWFSVFYRMKLLMDIWGCVKATEKIKCFSPECNNKTGTRDEPISLRLLKRSSCPRTRCCQIKNII